MKRFWTLSFSKSKFESPYSSLQSYFHSTLTSSRTQNRPAVLSSKYGNTSKFTMPTTIIGSSLHHLQRMSYCSKRDGGGDSKDGKIKIIIFYGSIRENRYAERVGDFVKKVLVHQGMTPITFDPLKMNFEMVKMPIHFYPPKDRDKIPTWLKEANETIQTADGFLVLASEYNSMAAPALTSMLSHFPRMSYIHRPAGLLAYGGGIFGGTRSAISLRCMLNDLGMVIIPTTVYIPQVQDAFEKSNGKCTNEMAVRNVKHLLRELHWYSKALKKERQVEAPPNPH